MKIPPKWQNGPCFPSRQGALSRFGVARVSRRRASSLVEFALVMPVLLLLILCMIQFGIILNARLSLSNTMRQVARYGAVNGTKTDADSLIINYAVSTAKSYGLTLKSENVKVGPPAQNTASVTTNRQRYVTQLPIALTYDLSPQIFMPVFFPGAGSLFKRDARYEVRVMVE